MKHPWQERIVTDPKIMFGKPVIKGTRIPVELILEKLALGETPEHLLVAYPRITREDIRLVAVEGFERGGLPFFRLARQILQSKSGIFGEKFNETSRKKGFPIAKDLHRNKSIAACLFYAMHSVQNDLVFAVA